MKMTNVPLYDYFDIPNAFMRGKYAPATASFEISWSGIINRKQLRDDAVGWGGEFAETAAKITFTAQSAGFSYTSKETTTQRFSIIGRERNGSYFREALPLLS